jgi:hypothetical protein
MLYKIEDFGYFPDRSEVSGPDMLLAVERHIGSFYSLTVVVKPERYYDGSNESSRPGRQIMYLLTKVPVT